MTLTKRIDCARLIVACVAAATTCIAPPAWADPAAPPPAQADRRFAERLDNLPSLANVGRVAPGIYRGAQPGKGGYATLKKMGIRTVIDLRTTEDERARVEGAGMRAMSVPLRMSRDGLREKVDRVVALMADPANQPVFVHCRHGQDRTGIVVAAYRMRVEGWSLTAAEAEMESFGFNDVWVNFKRFIRQYGAQNQKTIQRGEK